MRPAVIYGHPASLRTPQDFERLEEQTGRKAVIIRSGIRLIPADETSDLIDIQDQFTVEAK